MPTITDTDNKSGVKPKCKLQGKSNFLQWTCEFNKAAKDQDVLKLHEGEEKILDRPKTETFLQAEIEKITHVNKATAGLGNTSSSIPHVVDITLVKLQYDEAYKAWQENKEKVKDAAILIDEWVSDDIKIELEDMNTHVQSYKHIVEKYQVSNERAREILLQKASDLKLENFDSMQEHLNTHRLTASDLKKVEQTYIDNQMLSNILLGLPETYDSFKQYYRLWRPRDGKPDLNHFYEILLEQEEEVNRNKTSKPKKSQSNRRKDDRSSNNTRLKCTFADCGRWGHTEDACWYKFLRLKPQAIKDKEKEKATNKSNQNSNKKNNAGNMAKFTGDDIDKTSRYDGAYAIHQT